MRKATKQKCNRYIAGCDECNLIADARCKCCGDKCWLIKANLNTQKKLQLLKTINQKMRKTEIDQNHINIEDKIKNKKMYNMLLRLNGVEEELKNLIKDDKNS